MRIALRSTVYTPAIAAQWITIWQPSTARARRVVVQHVALDEVQMLVLVEVRELQCVAVEIVVDDDLVVVDQPLDQVRSDEAGAAGDAEFACQSVPCRRPLSDVCRCPRADDRRRRRRGCGAGAGSRRSGNSLSGGTPSRINAVSVLPGLVERSDDHQIVVHVARARRSAAPACRGIRGRRS